MGHYVRIFWLFLFAMTGYIATAQGQQRDRLRIHDHYMVRDGKVLQMRDGQGAAITSPQTLNNGTTVNPDGTVQMRGGKQLRLRDGECLDMDGNRYTSQDRMQRRFERQDKMQQRYDARGKNRGDRPSGQGRNRGGRS